MVNVRDFGAVGDGAVKDTAALQAALDTGATVVVPPKTYLSGTLLLHDNTELRLDPGATFAGEPRPSAFGNWMRKSKSALLTPAEPRGENCSPTAKSTMRSVRRN